MTARIISEPITNPDAFLGNFDKQVNFNDKRQASEAYFTYDNGVQSSVSERIGGFLIEPQSELWCK